MDFSRGWGGPLFRYCDLELDPMTFISELDLDKLLIYHCPKKKVSISSPSKVKARMDTETQADRQTDKQTHRRDKKITLRIRGR